jgi:ribose transport system permease protein
MRKPDTLSLLVFTRSWGIVILFAALFAVFSAWGFPIFGTFDNFSLILGAASISTIFAAAIAMGIFSGALDLSVPGIAALGGVVMAKLMLSDVNLWVAMLAAIVVGGIFGLVNAICTLRGLNPLAVTIGTLSVTSGLAAVVTNGPPLFGFTGLEFLGSDLYFGLPAPVYVVVIVYVLGTIFLTQTRGGTRFLAAGGNAEALRRSGVNANLYKLLGFVLSGVLAAVGGIVTTAFTSQASSLPATGSLFTGLTAVALSGISLAGGRGSLPKVFVGSIVISEIASILAIKNIQPFWSTVITGLLLIGALAGELAIQKQVSKQVVTQGTAANAATAGKKEDK